MDAGQLKDVADFAVDYAQSLGVGYAEARVQEDHSNSIIVKNGNVETGYLGEIKGIGFRVIAHGGVGFVSFNEAKRDLVRRLVRGAVSFARASSRIGKRVDLSREETHVDRWAVRERIPFDDVPIEDKVELLLDADRQILSVGGVKVPTRFIELTETRSEKYFINSDGCEISSYTPRVSLDVLITVVKGADSEQGRLERGGTGGWEIVRQWNVPISCAGKTRTLADALTKAKKAPIGMVDLILGSEVVGIAVHESVGHPYEADRILGREAAQAGESFVTAEKLGSRIGSDEVTVIDDPTLRGAYGFYRYDDEGVKARPRYLIKSGLINEFLHNRETASDLGVSSNAAARASDYGKEPIVRMANTFMAPGDRQLRELIEDVKEGVFVKSYGEWNIDDVRYNMRIVGSEAYLIKRGGLRGMVRRPVIELTTPVFYSRIDALTKEVEYHPGMCGKSDPVQSLPVWFGGPTIRLRNVRLGG